jgi:flagellar biosynthesis protein FlhG
MIAVASGKGGVGKTFISINLALALRERLHRCLLADLDWGLANVDVALGLSPVQHVGHVLAGECSLEAALVRYSGIAILPNGCGEGILTRLGSEQRRRLVEELRAADSDVVIADTHPGISAFTVDLLLEASAVVLVTTPEPTSLTDTYALMKVLSEHGRCDHVSLVVNQAHTEGQANRVAEHLNAVAKRYLGNVFPMLGHVPADVSVPRSVQDQRAVLSASSHAPSAIALRRLSLALASQLKLSASGPRTAQKEQVCPR